MSEPIKVGDLVMVVRGQPCCGVNNEHAGAIFTVAAITPPNNKKRCTACKAVQSELIARRGGDKLGFAISRLKRIPPLDELDESKQTTNLDEPAHV